VNKPVKPDESEYLKHLSQNGGLVDEQLIRMLERDVIDKNPSVSFDDIAELDDAKKIL